MVQAPVEGLALPVMSELQGFPAMLRLVQTLVRFAPALMSGEPD
jgi:hypothetical protein